MTARCRGESLLIGSFVATEQQQMADAEELKVQQFVLDVLDGRTTTNDMRDDWYPVFLLNGGSNGYRTGTAAHPTPLQQPAGQLIVYILTVVGGNIDILWIEDTELVYRAEKRIGAATLERRKHLKGEMAFAISLV